MRAGGAGKDDAGRKARADDRSGRPGYFDHLLENTPLCIFVLDWEMRMIYLNPAFQRLSGYRKADAASGHVVFSAHPDDEVGIETSVTLALLGRTTRCRCRFRARDGTYHPLELEVSPMLGDDSCRVLCVDIGGV